jgi:RPA family protein
MREMKPTAYKLKVEDLVKGEYIRSIGGTEPSHLLTPWGQRVTRARVMGTVVDKFVREDQSYAVLRLDDGSGTVSIRAWRDGVPELSRIEVGSTIDIIGRVREFEGEVYLAPELIIPVEDPNWELVRELEIAEFRREALSRGARPGGMPRVALKPAQLSIQLTPPLQAAEPALGEEEPPLPEVPEEIKKRIILAIEKLDRGSGASSSEVSNELNLPQPQVEDALRVLLVEGEIFEPQAGRFRLMR